MSILASSLVLQQCLPFTVLKPEKKSDYVCELFFRLQQPLPFTVLKPFSIQVTIVTNRYVATVLTVYGIETLLNPPYNYGGSPVATVLTVYGIETFIFNGRLNRVHIKLQ